MRCRLCCLVAAAVLALPACGSPQDGAASSVASTTTSSTPSTTSSTSNSSSSSTASTTPASTTTSPGAPPPTVLLVSDLDGVWLWSTTGPRRQLIDTPVAAAIPDRSGGVIYKELETGQWVPDEGQQSTARWRWVGEGVARPIRWLRSIGGTPGIVVSPPSDGVVTPLDVAVVEGHTSLLYLRTRHYTIVAAEDNPWWDSRVESFVVRDLETGTERVLFEHSTGWEYSSVVCSLGDDVAACRWHDYADEYEWVTMLTLGGGEVDTGFDPPACEPTCGLEVDLPPDGETLTWVGRNDGGLDVTVIDRGTGTVSQRASIVADGVVASIDSVAGEGGHRSVVLVHTYQPVASEARPVLRRGDAGDWVRLLQLRLDESGLGLGYLVPDGRFGSKTEELVKDFQATQGLAPTGVVGLAEWEVLIGSPLSWGAEAALHQPILVAEDGDVYELPVFAPAAFLPSIGQQVSLWSE